MGHKAENAILLQDKLSVFLMYGTAVQPDGTDGKILRIHLTYPSGKESIIRVWKGEAKLER